MADYLLPRWYGDKASHQALVEEMVKKNQAQIRGCRLLHSVLSGLGRSG